MHESIRQPAPQPGARAKRLTPELKALPIDPDIGIKLDFGTAMSLRSYANRHGWIMVQKRVGQDVIVWRIG